MERIRQAAADELDWIGEVIPELGPWRDGKHLSGPGDCLHPLRRHAKCSIAELGQPVHEYVSTGNVTWKIKELIIWDFILVLKWYPVGMSFDEFISRDRISVGQLFDWSSDRLIDYSVFLFDSVFFVWLIDRSIDRLIDWLMHSLCGSLFDWLIDQVLMIICLIQPTTPNIQSDVSSRIRPSESFGLNSDQFASGLRTVMNNVKTLTNNTTSILISSHEDDLLPTPLLPSPPASVAAPSTSGRSGGARQAGSPSEISSAPSSPDTEGPGIVIFINLLHILIRISVLRSHAWRFIQPNSDSPSLSRRSSQCKLAAIKALEKSLAVTLVCLSFSLVYLFCFCFCFFSFVASCLSLLFSFLFLIRSFICSKCFYWKSCTVFLLIVNLLSIIHILTVPIELQLFSAFRFWFCAQQRDAILLVFHFSRMSFFFFLILDGF